MENRIKGDFDFALQQLLIELVKISRGESKKSVSSVLVEWDINRGVDWYIDTLKREQERDLYDLQRLKDKYE